MSLRIRLISIIVFNYVHTADAIEKNIFFSTWSSKISDYMAVSSNSLKILENALFTDLSQLIEQRRQQIMVQVNSTVTILFFHIGKHINQGYPAEQRC